MVRCIALFMLLTAGVELCAQQRLDFAKPERLPATVNSDDEESMPLLSPDGTVLYFTRSAHSKNTGGKYTGSDIWVSKNSDGTWRKADNNALRFNNRNHNAVIGMSSDGRVVYLLDAAPSKKLNGIYFAKANGSSWSHPDYIPLNGIDNEGFIGMFVSPDFDVIFISMKAEDSRGNEDLYFSLRDAAGNWSKPKNLGATINTEGFEISPFLSADKTRLYFASSGHSGMGNADIFYADRLYSSWEVWSAPKNLGEAVNTANFEAYFSIYGDSVAYFTSNRASAAADIYKVKLLRDAGEKERQRLKDLVNETSKLLDKVRESTQSLTSLADAKLLIFFDNNTANLSVNSEEVIKGFASYLQQDGSKKVKIEYDGKLTDAGAATKLLSDDRVKKVKEILRTNGVPDNRVIIRNDFYSNESSQIRMNSFQISVQ